MMRRRTSLLLNVAVLGLTSVAWSSAGRAAPPNRITWWVETHPLTCGAQAGPLARQVQLACDATGRCAIASDEPSADRRAVLVCGDDGWTLEARDAKDQPLWRLALGTTDDDARLRNAGVWIARSEGEGPIDLPPSTAVATTHSPVPPSHFVALEPDRVPDDPKARRLSLVAMFHGASPRANPNDYGAAWGGRAVLVGSAPRTTGPLILGVAATAERSSGKTGYFLGRGGLTLGLGTSVGELRFGLLVEGGPALLRLPHPPPGTGRVYVPNSNVSVWIGYAQASLFAEWLPRGPIHPFVSPTVTWMIDHGADIPTQWIPNEIVSFDVGFVWGHM
jgi:hypothetical protein